MKWFKHDTDARNDIRIKLLKKECGIEGYGVYLSILEIIAQSIKKDNVAKWGYLDALYTTEVLAEEIGCEKQKLLIILDICWKNKLFSRKNKKLFCKKILNRLDEYAVKIRNSDIKGREKIGTVSRHTPDTLPTVSVKYRPRIEENRIDKKYKMYKKKQATNKSLLETFSTGTIIKKNTDYFINLFEPINPFYELLHKNKTERKAVESMIKKYGTGLLEEVILSLKDILSRPYAPKITSPYELQVKFGQLQQFVQQERSKPLKVS